VSFFKITVSPTLSSLVHRLFLSAGFRKRLQSNSSAAERSSVSVVTLKPGMFLKKQFRI
jgi:hypothetical protein